MSYSSHENGVIVQIKYIKHSSKRKLTEHYYHVKIKEDVNNEDVKVSCEKTRFPALHFFVLRDKPHIVCGLRKH